MDDGDDLLGGILDVVLIADGEVHLLHVVGAGEVSADGIGNEDGLVGDLGFAEGFDALFEGADDGEGNAADLKGAADGVGGAAEHGAGKGLGDDGDFAVGGFVLFVEEAAGERDEVADLAVLRLDAEDQHLFATPPPKLMRSCISSTAEEAAMAGTCSSMARSSSKVRKSVWMLVTAPEPPPAYSSSTRLVPMPWISLRMYWRAGGGNGDDENDRSGADDHAQRGEHEAHLGGAEAVDGQPGDLAEHHGLPGAGDGLFKGNSACAL